ncbi:MAG: DUF4342 domain-containing protein [Thermoanaerobaculia bacterium]|nr:DUF4342 domain-containing protein [Thermoanaerobaculia bacterium]
MPSPPRVEEFQVTGEQLVSSVKDLFHEGNIRRISIRNAAGVTLLEIPLVVGLAGAVLVPLWAALGALAALLAKCTLVVERVGDTPARPKPLSTKGRKSTS